MDTFAFEDELGEISDHADYVLEKEPSLTRFEALQLAAKISMHYQQSVFIERFKGGFIEEIKTVLEGIKTAIYETIP
jgi:hypothetical protein